MHAGPIVPGGVGGQTLQEPGEPPGGRLGCPVGRKHRPPFLHTGPYPAPPHLPPPPSTTHVCDPGTAVSRIHTQTFWGEARQVLPVPEGEEPCASSPACQGALAL